MRYRGRERRLDRWFARSYRLQFRIGIAEPREIGRPWARVQFPEQSVVQWRCTQLRDPTFLVVDIAKDDRLHRTSLRTGGCDLAIVNGTICFLRVNLHRIDALNAVSALFHDAARPDGDVR